MNPTHNSQQLLESCATLLQAMLCDAYNHVPNTSRVDLQRDIAAVRRRLTNEGLTFATRTLPSLSNSILEWIETGKSAFHGFKLSRPWSTPIFMGPLFAAANDRKRRIVAVRYLYQISICFKKLKGEYATDTVVSFWADFLKSDAQLEAVNVTTQTLKLARFFCKEDFSTIDVEDISFQPRPGPGATRTKLDNAFRYSPKRMYTRHDDVMPYADWFYPTRLDVIHDARNYISLMQKRQYEPVAKFTVVPKTHAKPRGICIEENEAQYLQQGISNGIRSHIRKTKLHKWIQIDNQDLNAGLAMEASKTMKYCTIDMSEASDRVARSVVLEIFKDTPLHDLLDAVATRVIVLDEKAEWFPAVIKAGYPITLKAQKFAPMGSGLCFPIMTLVHYYLIKALLCRHTGAAPVEVEEIYVYGDDIILPTQYAKIVLTYLPFYGMKLNETKSFWRGDFRESCGVHAINGVDITPVFFKYLPASSNLSPIELHSLSVNERSLRAHFPQTASYLRTILRKHGCEEVDHDLGLFGIHKRSTFWLTSFRKKWDKDLMAWMYRLPYVRYNSKNAKTIPTDTQALLRYWAVKPQSDRLITEDDCAWTPDRDVEGRPINSVLSVKWAWAHAGGVQKFAAG